MREENNALKKQLNNLVARTLNSGIKPFDVFAETVYDCVYGEAAGYKFSLYVNSLITGRLTPEEYMRSGAEEKILSEISFRAIKKTVALVNAAAENEKPVKTVFVRCAAAILNERDLYSRITAIINKDNLRGAEVYLEFFAEALETETEVLKNAFSDIRAAGLKIAVDGYGGQGFSIEKIISVCPDAVFTDGRVAGLATDREKNAAVAPLINLVKGLGGKVIAEGVDNDDELREFRTRDCFGFVPSSNYRGNTGATKKLFNAEELARDAKEGD